MFCTKCGKQIIFQDNFCQKCGALIAKTDHPVVFDTIDLSSIQYAKLFNRIKAFLIDLIILYIIGVFNGPLHYFLIGFVKSFYKTLFGSFAVELTIDTSIYLHIIISIFLGCLYFTFMESSSKKATFGKMAMKIIVTNLDGEKLSIQKSTARFFLKIFLAAPLLIGFLVNRYTYKKQALHDFLTGSIVIDDLPKHTTAPVFHSIKTLGLMNLSDYKIYAGFWKRFLAMIVDLLILHVIIFLSEAHYSLAKLIHYIYTYLTGTDPRSDESIPVIISIITINWIYYALMESSHKQATLGKIGLAIIVTDRYGNRISFGRATGRYFGKFISTLILLIGFIIAGFTKKKEALHDIMAGCLIINKPIKNRKGEEKSCNY